MAYILHLDMNSYFASVEQQANPLLRGKPVGVCAYLSPRGCIIASSKEAKKLGIKTGFMVADALKICPQIVLVENEPAKYRSTTEKIFKIFSDYTDRIEPYSIDEAFLDLTGLVKNFEEAKAILFKIKARIKAEVGEWLTSSAGLSWTRFLAKFASDISEKDSYLMIDSKDKMIEVFDRVKITEAWGIKEAMESRLNQLGIYTLNDLRLCPPGNLMAALGKMGYYLWSYANGIEVAGIRTTEEILPKSIGHSYCVPKQTNDLKYVFGVLMKLCEKTGRRLREQDLEGHGLMAGYSLKHGGGFFKHKKVYSPLFTTKDIYQVAEKIISLAPPPDKIYMIAVSVTNLRPMSNQLDLFAYKIKNYALSEALDKINERYGDYSVIAGRILGLADQAKDRIGFRKSVEVKEKSDGVEYLDEMSP